MEMLKKWKKVILTRCKSTKERSSIKQNTLPKCNSFPTSKDGKAKPHVAPQGYFTVYVGSERQRFMIKAKYTSHPLFMMLLDDAKQEYGYSRDGPIILPCEVDLFYKALAEMETDMADIIRSPGCGGCIIPSAGCGGHCAYAILSPSKLVRLNHVNPS